VKKGNAELRDWVNAELAKLGEEKFCSSCMTSTCAKN
jgi:hypothetical protein